MKIENNNGDPLWTNNTELLPNDECLPVIGSCQVSSILSNLDPSTTEATPNMDIIILSNSDFKIPIIESSDVTFQNNYVVLKDTSKSNKDSDIEQMLFFVCNLCPFLCTKNTKITEHLENAHKNKTLRKLVQLKCPACSNIFYHKMSLRSHLIHDHGVGNSDLSLIIQAVAYYSNKSNKSEAKIRTCKAEEAEAPEEDEDEVSNDDNNETCPNLTSEVVIDNLPLEIKAIVQTTVANNNSAKRADKNELKLFHQCILPSCKVRFQDLSKLNFHVKLHAENGFKCTECEQECLFWKPMAGHLWRLHKIDMELFACDKCDYKSTSLSKLNNIHKLIHGEARSFLCDVCQKGFKNSKQLRNHKITHKQKSDRVVFGCEVCTKSFHDRRHLKVHMDVVHKKIKPFLCNYCGYKGSSKSSLKMHIRQHTGEKPFACDNCAYITSDHNSLRRHKLRHTGQKPYKCPYCSYACIQSSTYKVHIKTKHPGMEKDLMYTCHECQFRSVNKEMFASHMVTVHLQKPESLPDQPETE